MVARNIIIEPFDEKCLGSNSYDVHLGDTILTYATTFGGSMGYTPQPLDCRVEPTTHAYRIGTDGIALIPGTVYLGSTLEYTETHKHVPYLDGKSSIGRLGITIHCTAGRGDVGFCNHWTLEIHVIQPVRVYAGMPIGQLTYHTVEGAISVPYNQKPGAKYNARDPKPQPSRMWKNFHEV